MNDLKKYRSCERNRHLDDFYPTLFNKDGRVSYCKSDLMKADEQARCFRFSNLQPLWAKDNLTKSFKIGPDSGTSERKALSA